MSFSYSEITSRKNEKIIWASKLSDKKLRDEENLFVTDGSKLLEEAILSGLTAEKIFFTKKALSRYSDLLERADAREYVLVTDEVFEKLSDESAPQGIFSVIRKPAFLPFGEAGLNEGGFVILDDIQNPQNLGAIFRCAYSLGATKLVLSRGCADVYNRKTLRSAMGSIFKCSFFVYDDISQFINLLTQKGNRVFCTRLHSDSLSLGLFKFENTDSIVMGNEGHGVSDKVAQVCTDSVIIPMTAGAESLNAATAAAIIMWEMNKAKITNENYTGRVTV